MPNDWAFDRTFACFRVSDCGVTTARARFGSEKPRNSSPRLRRTTNIQNRDETTNISTATCSVAPLTSICLTASLSRIALLGARITSGNLGVGALASGAIRCIRNRWPNAQIYILDYDKHPGQESVWIGGEELPIELVNIRFSKRIAQPNNIALLLILALLLRIIPSRKLRRKLEASNAVLRNLRDTDLVLSLAGGDSFSDIYGMRRLLYALRKMLAILTEEKAHSSTTTRRPVPLRSGSGDCAIYCQACRAAVWGATTRA